MNTDGIPMRQTDAGLSPVTGGHAGVAAGELILVLGMHRSGTSAVTGVLGLLGFELGDELLAPQADNPKGFFENVNVVATHDRLLRAFGGSWHDPRPLPVDWARSEAASLAQRELGAITRDLFSRGPRVVLKDPRICRLAPLWLDITSREGWTPKVIIVVRHPEEVARSLLRRDGMSSYRAKLLWLQHLMDAESATREVDRVFISYDALLTDWRKQLARMREHLGLAISLDEPGTAAEVEGFLSSSLRNHVQHGDSPSSASGIDGIVLPAYALAMRCCRDEVDDVGAAFTGLGADAGMIADLYLGAVEDALALELPISLQAEKDALQIEEGKAQLARQTMALVEFLRPKPVDVIAGRCKLYYRDEDGGYGEDRSVGVQPERDGREFTAQLVIPVGERVDFLRFDPDDVAGVFSLLKVEVGPLAFDILGNRVTAVHELLLPAPPGVLLMFGAVGNDPSVEFDLRGLALGDAMQPLDIWIRYRRETLASELESQVARSIDERAERISDSIERHVLEMQGGLTSTLARLAEKSAEVERMIAAVTRTQQDTLLELRNLVDCMGAKFTHVDTALAAVTRSQHATLSDVQGLSDTLQATATSVQKIETDQQSVRSWVQRRSFSYWWRRWRG